MTVPSPARTQDSGPYEAASWWSVALLAACAFVFVLAELMPVGLIPLIASEFSVSEGAAGYVTVIYAWTVGPAAIVVTALTRRMDRRQLLLWIVAIFMLANVGAAIAPSFLVLLATRALAALAHGVFWSIVGPYAVRLVREKNAPRAMAVAFSGISIATVVGVPLGAAIGIALGWRMALALIAVASAAVLLAAWIFMPSVSSSNDRAEARLWTAARRRPLTVLWFATALAIGGHFAAFTYVAPFVTDGLMLSPSTLPILLFVFGAAGLAGNGSASSRRASRAMRSPWRPPASR